jgi:hypothetical protein
MRHGLFTAGWLSSVFAAEGALVSEGIQNYTSPTTVGTSLLGLAGVMSATRWVKKKLTNFEEDPEVQ